MSFYRNDNQSNDFEDNKQINSYLSKSEDQNESQLNLYEQYQQNQNQRKPYNPSTGRIYSEEPAHEQHFNDNNANNPNNPNGIPSISAEDFRILRDCNKESFYYRCKHCFI